MTVSRAFVQSLVVLLALAQCGRSLEISDFYDFERTTRLENGADKSEFIKLDTPINFFSDVYDHIHVSVLNPENIFFTFVAAEQEKCS